MPDVKPRKDQCCTSLSTSPPVTYVSYGFGLAVVSPCPRVDLWSRDEVEDQAARASTAQKSTRRVYLAMLMLSDWKGRLSATTEDIGQCAGVTGRQVRRELQLLYASQEVVCELHGQGRRPSRYLLKFDNQPHPGNGFVRTYPS